LPAYGVDEVFLYNDAALEHFRIEPYAAVFEDFIEKRKPSIVLVGGTTIGRSLAPRVAARFRTGLTADCTVLDVQDNTDLDQIRPAFGGNIMAHIHTPNHRPQFATVRYKVFSSPVCELHPRGKITPCSIPADKLQSAIEVVGIRKKPAEKGIEEAAALVVAGRGVGKQENLDPLRTLARQLGGQLACTRPLVENGWMDSRCQIGLSGRTVRPELIITCGVSGAVQFTAGMDGAGRIIAINTDPDAPIFKIAHVGLVGDMQAVIPALVNQLEARGRSADCAIDSAA
jgi:electron transfer flavoprotein alpha subunit